MELPDIDIMDSMYDNKWQALEALADIRNLLKGDDSDLTKLKKIGQLVRFDYLESEWSKPRQPTIPQSSIK